MTVPYDPLDDVEYYQPFTAEATARTLVSGRFLYTWTELTPSWSGLPGQYVAQDPPRFGGIDSSGFFRTPLIERNNREVPTSLLPLKVQVSYEGMWDDEPSYGFDYNPNPSASGASQDGPLYISGGAAAPGSGVAYNYNYNTFNYLTSGTVSVSSGAQVSVQGPGTWCFGTKVGFDKAISFDFTSYEFQTADNVQAGPFDAPVVLMSSSAGTEMSLAGVEPTNVCEGGQSLLIVNDDTTYDLTIKHETGGTVTSRFDLPLGDDIVLAPGESRAFWYDVTILRWRLVGCPCDDKLVAVTSGDTTPGRLSDKLVAGSGVALTLNNSGGNEYLLISVQSGGYSDGFSGTKTVVTSGACVSGEVVLYAVTEYWQGGRLMSAG